MSLNFKKISAIAASALMVGLTLGTAAAVMPYPAPFVTGAGANVAIVYGSGASIIDGVQAGNIEANLQSFMGASTSGSTATTASGGDAAFLAQGSRKLYFGDIISAPLGSLSYTNMPAVLASGTFTDLSGTAYTYTQTVKVGPASVTFGTSGGDLNDPTLYIDAGNNGALTAGYLYNYTLSFAKSVNVSDSTNVQGQKINILGVDYVIGASSTATTLYLYGSGSSIILQGGTSQSVLIAGTSHNVTLITTAATTPASATISVDGITKTVSKGSNYAFAGGINVYVRDVINPAYAGDVRQVELIVGASSLTLTNGASVKKGADSTNIPGTNVVISGTGTSLISSLTVQIGAQKTQNDSISLGQSFTDPVFGGLKLTLANAVPTLDSTARTRIIADAGSSNTQYAYVTFTSAKAGSAGEQKLQYVYDNDTTTTATQPLLAHSAQPSSNGRGIIHILEGESAVLGDWIVVNQGDSGTILSVDSIDNKDGATGTVTLTDAICSAGGGAGCTQTVTLTNSTSGYINAGVNAWGGSGYTITVPNAASAATWTSVNITWNAVGTVAMYPRIKLANGGWLAFLTAKAVPNATSVIFPDGVSTLATTGTSLSNVTTTNTVNGIIWNVTGSGANALVQGIVNPTCNFNATRGPALLYIEPKKWNDGTYGNFICVPLTTTGTTQMSMGDPVFNGSTTNPAFTTFGSDTYKKASVDVYGTYTVKEDRTNANGIATIYSPSAQMSLDALFSSVGASVSASSTAAAGAQLGNVLVTDAQVGTVSATKNLIVVGGSCINTVAGQLLGGNYCGAGFTAKTNVGSGQFLIQSFGNALSQGKIALLVAGYEAVDTQHAATYLTTQPVDTTANNKYIGSTETTATLSVVTA